MTNQEAYEWGIKIHKQIEEYLKTHFIGDYTEGKAKLYESDLEYFQSDYIFDGKGMYHKVL